MPFAIEPIVNPTLDIPAPIVSVPQAGDRASGAAPSFQDHLDRAGRSSDGPSAGSRSSSSSSADDRNRVQTRRNDDDGDRAEAERREETTANDRPAESTASKSDESKSKPTHSETKVEAKKKPGEHHKKDEKKRGDEAANAAVVAAAGTQETTAQDEVTLTADEVAANAEEKETKIASPTDGKKGEGIGLPVDPTSAKQAKEPAAAKKVGTAGTDPQAQIAAVVTEAKTTDDTAEKDGEATADAQPAVPLISELQSTKIAGADDKKPKTRAELAAKSEAAAAPDSAKVVDAADDATSAKPATDGGAALAVQAIEPEKESTKTDGASAKNAEASFTAQLQGAVEAAAAATTTVATTDTTNTATMTDSTSSTPVAATTTTDTTKNANTKTGDATLTAVESLRSNSAKEATAGRIAGEESRQNDGLSTADRARLVQRVARAVRTATERGGELQIRLSPPELGQLRLQVQMTDGTLSARIEAESPQAKQVITENLGQLRERLAEQNIRVDRIDVELMNAGNGGSPNLPDRRQDFSHDGPTPRGFATNSRNSGIGDVATVEPSALSANFGGNGRLNVVI